MLAEQGTLHEYLRDSCWNYPAFFIFEYPNTPICQEISGRVRKFPGRVGVARRRNKAQRGGRRQQRRRPPGKSRIVLAWRDEEIRLLGEGGANKGGDHPGESRPCWRGATKE